MPAAPPVAGTCYLPDDTQCVTWEGIDMDKALIIGAAVIISVILLVVLNRKPK